MQLGHAQQDAFEQDHVLDSRIIEPNRIGSAIFRVRIRRFYATFNSLLLCCPRLVVVEHAPQAVMIEDIVVATRPRRRLVTDPATAGVGGRSDGTGTRMSWFRHRWSRSLAALDVPASQSWSTFVKFTTIGQ